jgi:integrase
VKVALGLDEAVGAFARYRPSYGTPVRAFVRECSLEALGDVQPGLTVDFVGGLQALGFSVRTVHRYRQAVNAFLCWLLAEGVAGYDEAALREACWAQAEVLRPCERAEPVYATEEEVRGILAAAYGVQVPPDPTRPEGRRQQLSRLRNIALVEALRATGARASELVALRRGDLAVEVQQAMVADGRRLYFDVRSWAALVHYLGVRDGDEGLPLLLWSRPVFVRHDLRGEGRFLRMRTRAVYGVIVKLRGEGGITAQGFRNRFARKVLEASRDVEGTAALLGVSAVRFRERYRGMIGQLQET